MFADSSEIMHTLASNVTAPNFTTDTDDLERELEGLLDDRASGR